MFTLEQIKAANSNVKSGADFPRYMQEIIKLGVTGFETYTVDGHSVYFGKEGYKIESGATYKDLKVAEQSNKTQFLHDLKANQQGKTDFPTFCRDSAKSGVDKWVVDTDKMTCSYYDMTGNELLVEKIPEHSKF